MELSAKTDLKRYDPARHMACTGKSMIPSANKRSPMGWPGGMGCNL